LDRLPFQTSFTYKNATTPRTTRAKAGFAESAAPVKTAGVAAGPDVTVGVQAPLAIAAALQRTYVDVGTGVSGPAGPVEVIGPTIVHGQSVIVRVVAAVTV